MRRFLLLGLVTLIALAGVACETVEDSEASDDETNGASSARDDVPISRVVLYRSGIAYVERQGRVDGDVLTLQIEPDQINDILTTLTVLVDGGDNVASSVGLPIERTVAEDLYSLPPQVRQQGGMLALLNAFRGAEVTIDAMSGTAEGRVVGTEALTNDDGNQIRRVTVMTDDGTLRQFRVDEIRTVSLKNDTLEIGLARSLDVSLGEGDWKAVELRISLSGDGPHDVFVSYVVEMPTWKPTYRVIIDDHEVHLQGWAVVDNVSGEDWDDISLSLVAGTPISFQYDLHSPRFVPRPDLTARGFEGTSSLLAPQIDDGIRNPTGQAAASTGSASERRTNRSRPRRQAERELRDRDEGGGEDNYWGDAPAAEPEPEPDEIFQLGTEMLVDGMASSAETEAFDNLFRYDIDYDIDVRDRSSALVTVINEPVDGEDVLYFDPANRQAGGNPYRAVRLTNETGFTVERGPLTIFKDSTFVGQAISPRIGESEMVFLPYSVDGRYRVTERQSSGQEGVRLVRIVNSVITSEVQNINRRTYQIINNSGDEARLYVRVPKRTNWILRDPPADSGVLDQGEVWYVPFELDGSTSQEVTIEEVTTVTRSVDIWSGIAAETIALYVSNPDADSELRTALEEVLARVARISEIQRELNMKRRQRGDVYGRMAEIRANLEALGDTRASRDLRRTLTRRLGDQEEAATQLTVDIVGLEEEEAELRALISTALMDVELTDTSAEPDAEAPNE